MTACKRCHRLLKNPDSITHGYGPSCWKKIQKAIENEIEMQKEKVYMNIKQNNNY